MPSYPGSVPSFTTKVDQVDTNFASHVNRLQDEVRAVARELGVNPRGQFETVRARLQDIASSKSNVGHNHDERYWQRSVVTSKGQILVGTSPNNVVAVSPAANGRVLLTDSSTASGVRWDRLTHAIFTDNAADNYTQYALADGSRGAFLQLSGGVLSGRVVLDGVAEKIVPLGNVNGTATLDVSTGSTFAGTLIANSIINFTGADGTVAESVTLVLQQGSSGDYELEWPAYVRWLGSGPPAPGPTGSFVLCSFLSIDGATWLGVAMNEF